MDSEKIRAYSSEVPSLSNAAGSALLGSMLKLARQRMYWSPRRLFRLMWVLPSNIPTQAQILRILSRPEYVRLIRLNPRFPFKHLARKYLARGFTQNQRSSCFIHHYRRLSAALPAGLLERVLFGDVLLFEICEGDHLFAINMSLSRPNDEEGELSLHLEVDGQLVFSLSSTFVPGWVVGSESEEVILITRLQGVKGRYAQTQLATKSLRDVAPSALLVAALSGVANAFGIKSMAGIGALLQVKYCQEDDAAFKEAYDKFFLELGAVRNTGNFYVSSFPLPEKPLSLIKRGHKTRTREKRAFKQQVAAHVSRLLRQDHS